MINLRPYLSIIIPLYNEQRRIANLSKVYKYLDKCNFSYEVLLINDGSTDNTIKEFKKIGKKFRFDILSYDQNKGKGFAIRQGMLKAKGKFRLFTDIDLSTPIKEFDKFLLNLEKVDILIGSRRLNISNVIIRQPFLREILGRGFTLLSQKFLQLKLSDCTCGFKCFSEKAAHDIFTRQRINRWGFDSEILFLAKKIGFCIKEIPVSWSNNPDTKVKFPQDIIYSLWDLLKIRYYDFKKFYK